MRFCTTALVAVVAAALIATASPSIAEAYADTARASLQSPNTTFEAGSWGDGMILHAAGFTPRAAVTIDLATANGNGYIGNITHTVYADPDGDIDEDWVPTAPPQAPAANGYPHYAVFLYQNAAGPTVPFITSNSINLTISASSPEN